MTESSGPSTISLTPKDAVAQYIAGGLTTAQGMPSLQALRELFAASIADRFAWAQAVAAEFVAQYSPTATDNAYTLGDVGTPPDAKITKEAFAYLAEVSGGFPYLGTWVFVRTADSSNAVPDTAPIAAPVIVATSPSIPATEEHDALPAAITLQHADGSLLHIAGHDLHAAFAAVVAFFEKIGHAL